MLPWSFSEEFAAEKYMAQLQHNMWVTNARMAALSIITGGGKWVEISIAADPLYQHLLLTAEKKFRRCVSFGEPPRLFGVEPPRPRIEGVRVVDMGVSNSWAEFATLFLSTRSAFLDHEKAKTELKGLMARHDAVKGGRHKPDDRVLDPGLHVLDGVAGVAFVPLSVEVLGHEAELDDEVGREVLRPDLPRFSFHRRIRALSSWPMMTRASEPPMK
jgi:hypothetical protein